MAPRNFRDHLPDLSQPRFTVMAKQDAHEYAHAFQETAQPPWIFALYQFWLELAQEPYKGITEDGMAKLLPNPMITDTDSREQALFDPISISWKMKASPSTTL